MSLDFEVRAEKGVFIGLSSVNEAKRNMYEIALGAWSNTGSSIRQCSGADWSGDCKLTVKLSTPNILSGYDNNDRFWITFHNKTIAVGRHGNSTPFMAATYPSLMEINYVGVFTGFGSNGYWKFHTFCY
ncbi:C3 and PZP-like alpha-2-macroglobulin domain-containing protein 8 [Diadema antillarum]|uniref:C3 and PZP-like alpha-2-macroglobulin domain-containing protein 8 n=1 Tax=Diadema antillarum TaxID=105358 RepID=UPI003A86CC86